MATSSKHAGVEFTRFLYIIILVEKIFVDLVSVHVLEPLLHVAARSVEWVDALAAEAIARKQDISFISAADFLDFGNWVFLAVIDGPHQIFVLTRSKHAAGIMSPGLRVLKSTFVINGLTKKSLIFDVAAFIATIPWLGLGFGHVLVHNL
jgi:hypothetical protein